MQYSWKSDKLVFLYTKHQALLVLDLCIFSRPWTSSEKAFYTIYSTQSIRFQSNITLAYQFVSLNRCYKANGRESQLKCVQYGMCPSLLLFLIEAHFRLFYCAFTFVKVGDVLKLSILPYSCEFDIRGASFRFDFGLEI